MSDRFYGHQNTAELCSYVIDSLFTISPPNDTSDSILTPPHSPSLNSVSQNDDSKIPPLAEFIAYALYRTRLPISITHQALLLLTRLKSRYPSARGTSTSPHRLFLSSLMLSSKISMDDTYSNKSWQIVGQGLFELREVNQMERELFAFLGWNVVVRDDELLGWIKDVVAPWQAEQTRRSSNRFTRSIPTPVVSTTSKTPASTTTTTSATATMTKRRRENSANFPTSSSFPDSPSSPSDCSDDDEEESIRHSRASDAARAILHGQIRSSIPTTTSSKSRSARRPSHTPHSSTSSRYHQNSNNHIYDSSSSSSTSSSSSQDNSGSTSPVTPISSGPLTPPMDVVLLNTCGKNEGIGAIRVAEW